MQKRKTFAALRFLPIASIIATALIYGISSLATAGVGQRGVPSDRTNAILPMSPLADNAPNDRPRSLNESFPANVYNPPAKPAGSSTTDSSTLLSLRFENTLNGENGESPVSSEGTSFQAGLQGQGVHIPTGGQITYLAADNINAREGTIEFWIKPNWNGNDNESHTILNWNGGAFGGMLVTKHGFSRLAMSMDRWAGWREVETDVSNWQAGHWHYVAITYSNTSKKIQIYTDGNLQAETTFTGELPLIPATTFQLGNYFSTDYLQAVMDDFRVSDRVRTQEEITSRFLNSLTVNSISVNALTKNLWPTWRVPTTITADTHIGTLTLPSTGATWTSSNSAAASVNSSGELAGIGPGSATITVNLNGAQASMNVTVNAPMRPPRIEVPTGSRAEPADGALYVMPVVSLRYIPTADGVNLDTAWAPGFWELEPITIATLEQRLDSYDEIRKFMLEEGSRFRGYGSQTPLPSLGYKVVATITVYEPPPPGKSFQPYGYHSEWFQMFERLGIQNYVENLGVKEIWYYTGGLDSNIPAYDPAIHPPENFRGTWESNMASPTTGDISNSNRDNTDLPIYNRTYILLHQGMRRLDTLTLHIDGHQWEQMLVYVNELRDGNNRLFWGKFVGYDANNVFQRGRAGWTHFAPNSISDYDYINFNPFNSDITDWKPEGGGQLISYSAATARDTPYVFPNNYLPPPRTEPHWYIYWRQSMPGLGNTITFDASALPAANVAGKKVEISRAEEICVAKGDHFETIKRETWETSPQVRIGKVTERNRSNQIESVESTGVNRMTNWWHFSGNWDAAIRAGLGLYEPNSCTYTLSAVNHDIPAAGGGGSVTVTAPSGCKWFASSNAPWTSIQGTDIGNGTGTLSFSVPANTTTSARSTSIVVAGKPVVINQASSSAGPISTGMGTNVVVEGSGVALTFANVTSAGTTTIVSINPSAAGDLAPNYQLFGSSIAFEINTTAMYQGLITACFNVPSITEPVLFSRLRVLHQENGSLIDRTTSHDFAKKLVCATVDSLGPFVVATTISEQVQFNMASVTVAEGAGQVSVTVTRLGSTAGALEVRYATSDDAGASNCNALKTGVANSRCDYGIAMGTLHFADGELSKQISIPIIDDSYVEGDEEFSVILSNPTGATLGGQSTVIITIIDNDSDSGSPGEHPVDQAGFFVRQHYLDFLNRAPDAAGLAFWANEISSCGTDTHCIEVKRINVSAAFYLSIEFQETGYLVYRIYKAAFGNMPDAPVPVALNEFLPDTQSIGRNVVVGVGDWQDQLENNKKAFVSEFVTRESFTEMHSSSSATEFVNALNTNAGGILSQTDRDQLIAALMSGQKTRAQVLREVAEHPGFEQQEFNRAFVLMQYFGYLRRSPNTVPDTNFDGYNFWLNKLNQFNGNFVNAEMVKAFILSGEYRQRFGP